MTTCWGLQRVRWRWKVIGRWRPGLGERTASVDHIKVCSFRLVFPSLAFLVCELPRCGTHPYREGRAGKLHWRKVVYCARSTRERGQTTLVIYTATFETRMSTHWQCP